MYHPQIDAALAFPSGLEKLLDADLQAIDSSCGLSEKAARLRDRQAGPYFIQHLKSSFRDIHAYRV
jgi:hypothetical protein